jgi:trigger factor
MAVPSILVNSELDKLVDQFKGDLAQYGMKPEDYLASIKKTEEDLRNEWKPEAEKRAKMNIVLAEIAITEKLEPNAEEVEMQSAQLVQMYADLDPLRAKAYVHHMLTNEEVFKFLEQN